MSIESRIANLERRAGVNTCPCRDAWQSQIVYEENGPEVAETVGPTACERCGRELPIVRIVVVYTDNRPAAYP